MAASEKKSILSFSAKNGIREYSEGYKLYEMRRGFGAGREIKATLFFFLAMGMLFILMLKDFDIARLPVCAVILLVCMHMCSYYIFIMPKKAKLMGEHIYKSSRLIGRTYSYEFSKEYFVMKNKYQCLKRYYTELSDSFETDDLFVLIGGIENKLIVIPKSCMESRDAEKLSGILRKETIKQYRRLKSRKRKH